MTATATMAKLLTLEETAALFHVGTATISRWLKVGRLPRPVRVGRRWLFDAEAITAHIEQLRVEASSA
jgi:excisionase family DNA binding protein